MGSPATLKKISTQLNLSISTVSRALKNHPDISEKTKRKVRELALLMEYEPNSYAVNLRTNKSKILGLIVPVISNLFYESVIDAVEEDARKHGYSVIILQSANDPLQESENLKICKLNRVDGVLISLVSNSQSENLFTRLQENGIPVIFFDKVPENKQFDTVCMADEEAAIIAAETILKKTKKNILALFGNKDLSITRKRKDAFLKTINKGNHGIVLAIHHCNSSEETQKLLNGIIIKKKLPDHIFCMSDEILVGVMKSINHSGVRVPEDVSILAISNGFIPGLFKPPITYIETSGYELGKLAIKRMLELVAEKTAPRTIIQPSRLVHGESM
jgi:LacI family transcriptional regulator